MQENTEVKNKSYLEVKKNFFVGCCKVEVKEKCSDVTFPMIVMYPTAAPEKIEKLGPYSLKLAMGAEPKKEKFSLVLISHGSGGSHLLYRMLAHYLASNGFIVGLPEHPFNNRNNNSLEGTAENLANRPRQLNSAIDWFFNNEKFKELVKTNSVSIIGHSMGGYTALAAAGGVPTSFPRESADGQPHLINVEADSRITALVLLAPAAVWFKEKGALNKVNLPILMLTAEKDQYTPEYHAQIILEGVPDPSKVQHKVIQNAGHFSFLTPFPEAMRSKEFLPSQDPEGFNREEFHQELNGEILDFLECFILLRNMGRKNE